MTDFPCCDNGEHNTDDALADTITDALQMYDPTMDCAGIANHLAVVVRREWNPLSAHKWAGGLIYCDTNPIDYLAS